MKVQHYLAVIFSVFLTSTALGQTLAPSDTTLEGVGLVEILNLNAPTRTDHDLVTAYLEFQTDLPSGTQIELWWSGQAELPWEGDGQLLDLWVVTDRTGSLVRLSLREWLRLGGDGKVYLREGLGSRDDTSGLSAESISGISVRGRFRPEPRESQ